MTAGQAVTKTVSLNSRRLSAGLRAGCVALRAAVQGRLSKSRGRAAPAAVLAVCLAPALPGDRDVDARFAKVFTFLC